MTKELKEKIIKLVENYKRMFSGEYEDVKKIVADKRKLQLNKFGSTKFESVLGRHLLEMPETLHSIFINQLTSDEIKSLKERVGMRWFAKQFNEFSIAEKI